MLYDNSATICSRANFQINFNLISSLGDGGNSKGIGKTSLLHPPPPSSKGKSMEVQKKKSLGYANGIQFQFKRFPIEKKVIRRLHSSRGEGDKKRIGGWVHRSGHFRSLLGLSSGNSIELCHENYFSIINTSKCHFFEPTTLVVTPARHPEMILIKINGNSFHWKQSGITAEAKAASRDLSFY